MQIPATLEIGSQLLDAKLVPLRNPIMITKKVTRGTIRYFVITVNRLGHGNVEYEVIGVVRRKFVFKNRPKPLAFQT